MQGFQDENMSILVAGEGTVPDYLDNLVIRGR